MFKKIRIVVAVVFVVIVLAAIFPVVKSHLQAGRKVMADAINENTPITYDEARIEALLKEDKIKIASFQEKISEIDGRTAADRKKRDNLVIALKEQYEGLQKAKDLILEGKAEYIVNGITFKFIDIDTDATRRVEFVKRMEDQIAFLDEIVSDLNRTATSCRVNLANARKSFTLKVADFEKMKARKVNAEIKQRVWELSTEMNGYSDDLSSQTELQKAMNNYQKKIAAKEINNTGVPTTQTLIDYSTPNTDSQTTVDKIDEILADKS